MTLNSQYNAVLWTRVWENSQIKGLFYSHGINQYVANVIFLWGMNIQIYLWPQNVTNISELIYLSIDIQMFKYIWNIYKSKNSTNKCSNIFAALKLNKYIEEWMDYSINV